MNVRGYVLIGTSGALAGAGYPITREQADKLAKATGNRAVPHAIVSAPVDPEDDAMLAVVSELGRVLPSPEIARWLDTNNPALAKLRPIDRLAARDEVDEVLALARLVVEANGG